jgi:cytochrome c-type biogenesis protein CcsB
MAALSNQLLVVAIFGYLAAMVAYAAEYAFGGRGAVARIATRELVGAGGPPAAGPGDRPVGPGDRPAGPGDRPTGDRPRPAALGWLAVALTVLAAAAHAATLVTRGLAADRVPWGNMYEYVLAVGLAGVVVWLVLLARRPELRPLGLFTSLVLFVLLGLAGMVLYRDAAPLVPALNSYWLKIHVSLAAVSSGILLIGFVAAVLTLVRSGYERGKPGFPYSLGERLPGAAALERVTFRVHAFAFPIWTVAIICGAIWAEAAWGRYWGWDPKETWSFVTWVVYAGYLHARATPSVRRSTATWIAVAGWAVMLFNLFGVNLVLSGLHSYAGLD